MMVDFSSTSSKDDDAAALDVPPDDDLMLCSCLLLLPRLPLVVDEVTLDDPSLRLLLPRRRALTRTLLLLSPVRLLDMVS